MPWWLYPYPYYVPYAPFRYPLSPWYFPAQYFAFGPLAPYSIEAEKQMLLDMKAFLEEQLRYIEDRLQDIERQTKAE